MEHRPLICTNNTLGNIDYKIPIIASKSTDYRTSTGTYHRLIPNVAQEFDCRVKARVKAELLKSKPTIRDVALKSLYGSHYVQKCPCLQMEIKGPPRFYALSFTKAVQERIFKKPPPPKEVTISEMKDKYYRRFVVTESREVFPPEPYAKCEIKGVGRDEQPSIPPEKKGFYRKLDPYVSENRSSYITYSKEEQEKSNSKLEFPKERLVSRKKVPMNDSIPFRVHPTDRQLSRGQKRVPNLGATSEYNGNFKHQSFSNMYPYLFQNGVEFPESLSGASAWQNLIPPGMYCTDYCHIGTGWPINAVINYGFPKEPQIIHKSCCTKFCDYSQ